MTDLLRVVQDAEKRGIAIGHFNIANLEMLKALSYVAKKLNVPVVVGTSEGEREYIGIHHAVDLIASYNKEHQKKGGYRLFLNADHTYDLEKVREAAGVGYDAIVFDPFDSAQGRGAQTSFEEIIDVTRKAVKIAKKVNRKIVVEGELGYNGKSSKLIDAVPEGAKIDLADLPTAEQARQFVKETGVHMLAPAVGNIHGMLKNAENPNLQIERIREIRKVVGVPLVLHGGSGVSDNDFRAAIKAGISTVHISTEMRVAWRTELEKVLKEHPEELASYKLFPRVIEGVQRVVENRLRLFNNL